MQKTETKHILNKFSSKEMKIINNLKFQKPEPKKKTEDDP